MEDSLFSSHDFPVGFRCKTCELEARGGGTIMREPTKNKNNNNNKIQRKERLKLHTTNSFIPGGLILPLKRQKFPSQPSAVVQWIIWHNTPSLFPKLVSTIKRLLLISMSFVKKFCQKKITNLNCAFLQQRRIPNQFHLSKGVTP